MDDMVELSAVEARLEEEAARFDAARGGSHRFNNIRRFQNPNGANWTANYGVRGGAVRLENALDLREMREVLERVQAEMPQIRFDR